MYCYTCVLCFYVVFQGVGRTWVIYIYIYTHIHTHTYTHTYHRLAAAVYMCVCEITALKSLCIWRIYRLEHRIFYKFAFYYWIKFFLNIPGLSDAGHRFLTGDAILLGDFMCRSFGCFMARWMFLFNVIFNLSHYKAVGLLGLLEFVASRLSTQSAHECI